MAMKCYVLFILGSAKPHSGIIKLQWIWGIAAVIKDELVERSCTAVVLYIHICARINQHLECLQSRMSEHFACRSWGIHKHHQGRVQTFLMQSAVICFWH
jgi:hypothetical protein